MGKGMGMRSRETRHELLSVISVESQSHPIVYHEKFLETLPEFTGLIGKPVQCAPKTPDPEGNQVFIINSL